jgi:glycosyltransferase involved in cell wall biosynthesis
MSKLPVVSVIMPVFNSERFLSQAIQSILDQTFQDFELIIIDDGSDDSSWEIVSSFQRKDSRIRAVKQPENQGVAASSNQALDLATGRYIARMDSDDISLPDRLTEQVSFMESHPDVGIMGSKMRYMNEDGKLLNTLPVFQKQVDIHWAFMFESPFHNPTVMFRKSLVDYYGLRYEPSAVYGEEDYELWSRLLPLTKGVNLPRVLLYYRINSQSLTHIHTNNAKKFDNVTQISTRAVQLYLPEASVTKQEIVNLQRAIVGFPSSAKRQRSQLISVYFKIWKAFVQKHREEDLHELRQTVFAWAARMILYPPFQEEVIRALWLLTKTEWRWPLFLLEKLPYYWERRRF